MKISSLKLTIVDYSIHPYQVLAVAQSAFPADNPPFIIRSLSLGAHT